MKLATPLTLAGLAAAVLSLAADAPPRVPFPNGYSGWTRVKTTTVRPGEPAFPGSRVVMPEGGIHHVYANALAAKGYESRRFADGSVIAFDRLEYVANGDGPPKEGKRRQIDVIVKDQERFKETNGWGYESFLLDSRVGTLSDAQTKACASCHTKAKDEDYVFSAARK